MGSLADYRDSGKMVQFWVSISGSEHHGEGPLPSERCEALGQARLWTGRLLVL